MCHAAQSRPRQSPTLPLPGSSLSPGSQPGTPGPPAADLAKRAEHRRDCPAGGLPAEAPPLGKPGMTCRAEDMGGRWVLWTEALGVPTWRAISPWHTCLPGLPFVCGVLVDPERSLLADSRRSTCVLLSPQALCAGALGWTRPHCGCHHGHCFLLPYVVLWKCTKSSSVPGCQAILCIFY